ncbi:MAG: hypothetical protein WAL84_15955, partial [Candidatus Dormiibacterota bacterium]
RVGRAMWAGTYAAPRPIGMFQMLLLAKGQRNLLRVPAGAGVGVCFGLGIGALAFAVAAAVAVGVLVAAGEENAVGPPTALEVGPAVDAALKAGCVAAGPQATRMSIRLDDTTKSRR